jgi:hypothetical protein
MPTIPHSLTRRAPLAALFFASFLAPACAFADPPDPLDPVSFSVGGFFVRPDASLGINTQYGAADSGDVSAHSTIVPRVQANILIGNSQGLALDYYGFYRRYSDTLDQSVSLGGNNVSVNGSADANVGLDVANLSYKWWFGNASDVFGLGAGVAYYHVHLGTNGTVSTNVDNATGAGSGSYSADTAAPLLQAGWRHAFDRNTRMYVDLSGVEKRGGNLTGHIYNAALGAEWYFLKNVGIGAEYSATRIRLNDAGDGANLDMNLNGPSLFLKARF